MRVEDWEIRLALAMDFHFKAMTEFGVSDCYIVCADAVAACLDKEPFEGVRGSYNSEIGAAKILNKRGFKTVSDAWASLFDQVSPLHAQRGDICVFETDDGLAGAPIVSGGALMKVKGKIAPAFLSPSSAKIAFRVL